MLPLFLLLLAFCISVTVYYYYHHVDDSVISFTKNEWVRIDQGEIGGDFHKLSLEFKTAKPGILFFIHEKPKNSEDFTSVLTITITRLELYVKRDVIRDKSYTLHIKTKLDELVDDSYHKLSFEIIPHNELYELWSVKLDGTVKEQLVGKHETDHDKIILLGGSERVSNSKTYFDGQVRNVLINDKRIPMVKHSPL